MKAVRVLNIRGTSGTGKTTIVREILHQSRAVPLKFEGKKVRAYMGRFLNVPIIVLGSYETTCGGCDTIPKVGLVADLLHEFKDALSNSDGGVIVFEGLMISHMLGTVGKALADMGKENVILAWLDTPLELALERVQARRDARGDTREFNPANTTKDYRANELCQINARKQDFIVDMLGHKTAIKESLGLLAQLCGEVQRG